MPEPFLAPWKPHRRWWVLAHADLTTGAIYIRPGFKTLLRTLHEVIHVVRGADNRLHRGHGWHFCARSWHMFRRRRCATAEEIAVAKSLLR